MEDYEVVIDDSTANVLAALADVGEDDVFALAKTAEIDPKRFRMFLAEYGETENPHALELLRAAEFLRSRQRETLFDAALQKQERIWTRLKYLFIGGGIGAILGLLFAPKAGQELRGDIADASRKGIDRSREAAQQLGDRAGEYYEATRERASELYTQAAGKVSEVAETAREAASRQTGTVAAAIEAGRKAYQEERRKTELSGQIETASTHDEASGEY
jgi:gas vesicle protein